MGLEAIGVGWLARGAPDRVRKCRAKGLAISSAVAYIECPDNREPEEATYAVAYPETGRDRMRLRDQRVLPRGSLTA